MIQKKQKGNHKPPEKRRKAATIKLPPNKLEWARKQPEGLTGILEAGLDRMANERGEAFDDGK